VAKKKDADPSPDKLIRDEPRHYHTADRRFEVQAEPTGSWYLTDAESTNELGLPRLIGPFGTLDEVRTAVAEAREKPADAAPEAAAASTGAESTPAGRPKLRVVRSTDEEATAAHGADGADGADGATSTDRAAADAGDIEGTADAAGPRPRRAPGRAKGPSPARVKREPAAGPPPPAPKPARPTWLDRLDPRDRSRARELIASLEGLGIDDPEPLVRSDIGGSLPRIATALLLNDVWTEDVAQWTDEGWVDDLAGGRGPRGLQRDAGEALERLLDAGAQPSDLARLATLIAARTAGLVLERVSLGRTRRGVAEEIPGWRLLEVDHRGRPTGRSLAIAEDDLLRAAPKPTNAGS
jgi:hypothetical protein